MRRASLGSAGVALVATGAFSPVVGATKMDAPPDAALDGRIKKLESELRCLVCQNQTLADSNASWRRICAARFASSPAPARAMMTSARTWWRVTATSFSTTRR